VATLHFTVTSHRFLKCYKPKSVKEAEEQILSYGAEYLGEEDFTKRYFLEQRAATDRLDKINFYLDQNGYVHITIVGIQIIPGDPSNFDYDKYFDNMPLKADFPYYTIVQLPDNAGGY